MKEKTQVANLWNEFFDEFRTQRFGARDTYDLTVFDQDGSQVYQGGRILTDFNHLKYCFDCFLQESGFTPDDSSPLLGSRLGGERLQHWLKYSHPTKQDLWVNYFGHESPKDGAWLDLILTNSPERIINRPNNYAVAEALEDALSRKTA